MKREFFEKAGRLDRIIFTDETAISLGERNYARIEVKVTPATYQRLVRLAQQGYGSKPNPSERYQSGIVYRSPWAFMRAVLKTQKLMITTRWKANKKRRGRRSD